MDYDNEQLALVQVLEGRTDKARYILREQLTDDELDRLTDALDRLAAMVDEEANMRKKRR